MEEKKSSSKGLIIVLVLVGGGFVLVACTGILAAIAIPSFTKYIAKSKEGEAQLVTRQLADKAAQVFTDTCQFPVPLPATSDPESCCGGKKCLPTTEIPAEWTNVGTLGDPSYFTYSAIPSPEGYTIRAVADFSCGGPRHTMTVQIIATEVGSCSAEVMPAVVENAFE